VERPTVQAVAAGRQQRISSSLDGCLRQADENVSSEALPLLFAVATMKGQSKPRANLRTASPFLERRISQIQTAQSFAAKEWQASVERCVKAT
jgi:hypothetical protein